LFFKKDFLSGPVRCGFIILGLFTTSSLEGMRRRGSSKMIRIKKNSFAFEMGL